VNQRLWTVCHAILVPIMYGLYRLRRRGAEHLPAEGPLLVASNHVSVLDPPFVGMAVAPRRAYYMAKSELFRRPAFAWVIRGLGAFPVVRGGADRDAIRTSRELLAAGEALIMFPEGTRSRDGRMRPGFTGAGAMALAPGVTVVPAAIWGTQHRLGPVRVVFGPPVDLSDLEGSSRGQRSHQAIDRIMAAIAALVPEAGGPAQDPPVGIASLGRT
jgi:1-acyl-sn-glycerol-3-phosphate acyltransferase